MIRKTDKVKNIFSNNVTGTGALKGSIISGIGVEESKFENHVGLKLKILNDILPNDSELKCQFQIINLGNAAISNKDLIELKQNGDIIDSSFFNFDINLRDFVLDEFIRDCNIYFEVGDLAYILKDNNKYKFVEIKSIQKYPDDPENENENSEFGAYYNYEGIFEKISGKKKERSLRKINYNDLTKFRSLF